MVELIGKIDFGTGNVTDPELFNITNIEFIGGGRGIDGPGDGAIIEFSRTTAGLFVPGAAVMIGWTWKGITFRYSGVAGVPSVSFFVFGSGAGVAANWKFEDCTFDGLSSGSLPNVMYLAGMPIDGIQFIRCDIFTTDTFINQTIAGGPSIVNLTVEACRHFQFGPALGAEVGFIRDEGNGAFGWRVKDCFTDINGHAVRADGITGCRITDNEFNINVDEEAIILGDNDVTENVSRVWIRDNEIGHTVPLTSKGAVSIYTASGIRPNMASIFVHDNRIDGADDTDGFGILIDGDGIDGILIHNNMITNYGSGITIGTTGGTGGEGVILGQNIIDCGISAIMVGAAGPTVAQAVAIGNVMWTDNDSAVVATWNAENSVFVGNVINPENAGTTATGLSLGAPAADSVVASNVLNGDGSGPAFASQTDRLVFVGNNLLTDGAAKAAQFNTSTGAFNVIIGNFVQDELDINANSNVITGNWVETSIDFNDTTTNTLTGNAGGPTLVAVGDNYNITGNDLGAVDTGAAASVGVRMVGNDVDSLTLFSASSNWVFVGNRYGGATAPTVPSTTSDLVWVGNDFSTLGAVWTYDSDVGVLTANLIGDDLTLAVGSSDIAAAANRVSGGTFTDSGTGNTTDGSNDT